MTTSLNEKIGKYRWTICALLFFATTINYMDRQVLSLLKDSLENEYNWTDSDYANITTVFQITYALSMLFAGRFIDWLGVKRGYVWSVVIWSIGAIVHALARGTSGFMLARGVLGFGESGNFPAAIKATTEYFPKKERALATGIFNSGANVGAILAPLCVPWIAINWGWQWAFIIVGAMGFVWLIFWIIYYDEPKKQHRLGAAEWAFINSDPIETSISEPKTAIEPKQTWLEMLQQWGHLLSYKQTWSFVIGKFLTDGIWWFFLFWLPAYLKAQYNMTGTAIALPIALLYTMTCFGSIGGGALPMYFINKGYEAYAGRMRAMFFIALVPLLVLTAQYLGTISYWWPIIIIGIGASAHQAWSANIFTTVSDMFPKNKIGSIIGIGGMAGGIGGIVVNKIGGWLFDAYRQAGIAQSWLTAKSNGLASYVEQISSKILLNKHGELIDLNVRSLSDLSKEIVIQLQSDSTFTAIQLKKIAALSPDQFELTVQQLLNPALQLQFEQMATIQNNLVQAQLSTAYTIMFAVCATAYLLAWCIMKVLVPKFTPIND